MSAGSWLQRVCAGRCGRLASTRISEENRTEKWEMHLNKIIYVIKLLTSTFFVPKHISLSEQHFSTTIEPQASASFQGSASPRDLPSPQAPCSLPAPRCFTSSSLQIMHSLLYDRRASSNTVAVLSSVCHLSYAAVLCIPRSLRHATVSPAVGLALHYPAQGLQRLLIPHESAESRCQSIFIT
jgi:hypothetical protein